MTHVLAHCCVPEMAMETQPDIVQAKPTLVEEGDECEGSYM